MKKTDGLQKIIKNWLTKPRDLDEIVNDMYDPATKDLASAIRTYISECLPQEKELEYLPDGITPDYDISQSEEGWNACLKSVREALRLGEKDEENN